MKMLKSVAMFLLGFLVGCSGSSIEYRGAIDYPADKQALAEFIVSYEASIEGLQEELKEVKESRDAMVEVAKTADGMFEKSDLATKVSRANSDVESVVSRLSWYREILAIAKHRLSCLEETENGR